MTTTDSRSRKRRNGLIAAAAGIALLIGGSTYALWSASDSIQGGTITAGDLNLVAGESQGTFDVSADRSDSTIGAVDSAGNSLTFVTPSAQAAIANSNIKVDVAVDEETEAETGTLLGHQMNLATWLMVPGDTAAMANTFDVTLKGDNLVAALTLDATKLIGEVEAPDQENTDVTYLYAVFDKDGNQIGSIHEISAADLENEALPVALFQAPNVADADLDSYVDSTTGPGYVPLVDTDGTATITLAVFAHFDVDTPDRDNVNAKSVIGELDATLTQVRNITDLFNNGTAGTYP